MNKYKEAYDASLKHSGVKGMKWGVRKRVKAEISSAKREFGWNKSVKNKSNFSDDDLRKLVERIRMENDLKRLGGKKNRKEYLQRSKLSQDELKKRVARLQLEDNLKQQVALATKWQTEIGKSVSQSFLNVSLSMAVGGNSFKSAVSKEVKNKMTGGQKTNSITPGSVATSIANATKDKKKP